MSRVACFVAFALTTASSADAGDRQMTTEWLVKEDTSLIGERDIKREDYVFKQQLLPTALVELVADQSPVLPGGLTNGAQLIEIKTANAIIYCDPNIRAQKAIGHAQPCLVDTDADGKFDGMFLTTSVTKGLLTVQGNRPKTPKVIAPLAYRKIPSESFAFKLFVGIQYRGNANPVGNHIFQINYGDDTKVGSLTERLVVAKKDIPGASRQWFGGAVTVVSETPTGVRVRVEKVLPSQSFGVVQTTTYRIY